MSNEISHTYPTTVGSESNLYAQTIKVSDGAIWDVENTEWVTFAVGDLGDYDLVIPNVAGDWYAANFPPDIAIGTQVEIIYYLQLGASPAEDDLILRRQGPVTWTGAVDAGDLGSGIIEESWVTLAQLKDLPGISSYLSDSALAILLNGVINGIENYCDRHFKTGTYSEWMNGKGAPSLWVKHRPISEVLMVSDGHTSVLDFLYENANAAHAFTRITAAAVILKSNVGGASSSPSFAFATYATIATLQVALNATTNWTVNSLNDSLFGARLSEELMPRENAYSLGLHTYGNIPYRYLADYRVEEGKGRIVRAGGVFSRGIKNHFVKYTGGYGSGEVPEELTLIVLELCRMFATALERDPTLLSYRLGDEAWTRGAALFVRQTLDEKYASALARWRNLTV